MKNDLISRQALCEYALNQKDKSITPNDIMRFPSAQPVAKDINVPVKDCISRQAAIDEIKEIYEWHDNVTKERIIEHFVRLPSAQPETHEERTETHACDLISRKKVRYKLTALVNELEEIFANIRERNEDDSVCGLCEYDGAYIGQSGYWCNECPGFDKSDCFKLKDKYRHEWETIDE